MAMLPWYKVITPREDLRKDKPLDASEFAVHLGHVRDGRAPEVYQNPAEFFERTFLTRNLKELATQVLRRLSGIKVETSAVFNLSTQFGGGKTHSLTLLYHLASSGDAAKSWKGIPGLLQAAGVAVVPKAETAVFVGTEFDSITGRGGADGTPLRKTPWGEIAYQVGGTAGFQLVAEHDEKLTAPGGDVIEQMLPSDRPVLILLDELMNYVSRTRKSGLASQLYTFLHNLSEVARARDNVVLAVSIPASELEMTVEDQSDFERFKKLLDRLGKAMIMSAETETSEIIRRRLFEWHSWQKGVPDEAIATINDHEAWLKANKQQIPSWFPMDNAREELKAAYPFHPALLSVFERKWRSLPRFQQTRGVLRLLALWVSKAYKDGYNGAQKDPLISLGTAPLEDPLFRAALFEQLGESRLEAAVTTDIAGKEHAHALRLDADAAAPVKKARLHRKVATTILFESNGGQQRGEVTLPEVRLAVAEPGIDIGNVEQCLEALVEHCYFISAEKNRYRIGFQPNLNKLLADRRAGVSQQAVDDKVKAEIQKVFTPGPSVNRVYFPRKSNDIPDNAVLTLVILPPEAPAVERKAVTSVISVYTQEHGASSRTFKSALIWAVAEDSANLREEARKLLAWKDIHEEADELKLDPVQRQQLKEHVAGAERDLKESVWRAYKNVFLLADDKATKPSLESPPPATEDKSIRHIDLGLVHSSASSSLVELIIGRLKQEDLVVDGVSANLLARHWPPALPEWSTRSVRDAFFASPRLPRLLKPAAIKETIANGVSGGQLAYVGKLKDGSYEPFRYKEPLTADGVEISDEMFIITKERAEEYLKAKSAPPVAPPEPPPIIVIEGPPECPPVEPPTPPNPPPYNPPPATEVAGFTWKGEITPQKWTTFYMKVLSKFATGGGVKLALSVEVAPPGGVPISKVEEAKVALRELGMDEGITVMGSDA